MESLNNRNETLGNEVNIRNREIDENNLRMKETRLQFETHMKELEKKAKTACIDLWKKEALLARITSENEVLVTENQRLKGVNTINDSILKLPSACFVDI